MSTVSALAESENDATLHNNKWISLKQFPPKLRKLAVYLLQMDKAVTIKQACEEIDINYNSARTMMDRYNFREFISNIAYAYLDSNLVAVDVSLVNGAVSGSHNHQKLYYQRIGKLTEQTINTSITLAIGMNVTAVTPADQDRSKGVIDVEPVIPS